MATKTSQCKLCDQPAKLCNSHIVPKHIYAPMKNDQGQIITLNGLGRKGVMQDGHKERLLCRNCEQMLSTLESEFAADWVQSMPEDFSHLKTGPNDVIEVSIKSFENFKRFHMSVFWRAAVSADFKIGNVDFGPHLAKIRQVVAGKERTLPGEYPIVPILSLDEAKQPVPGVVQLAQGKGRLDGKHHYYLMAYACCDWILVVTDQGKCPTRLRDYEDACFRGNVVRFVCQQFSHAKSTKLWVDMLRKIPSLRLDISPSN